MCPPSLGVYTGSMTNGTTALTDNEFALADRIEADLERHPSQWFTPSQVARRLGEDTVHVRRVLQWMVRNQFADADNSTLNSRTHYKAR